MELRGTKKLRNKPLFDSTSGVPRLSQNLYPYMFVARDFIQFDRDSLLLKVENYCSLLLFFHLNLIAKVRGREFFFKILTKVIIAIYRVRFNLIGTFNFRKPKKLKINLMHFVTITSKARDVQAYCSGHANFIASSKA